MSQHDRPTFSAKIIPYLLNEPILAWWPYLGSKTLIINIPLKTVLVIFMQYSRLHTGDAGENAAEFTSICEHVTVAFPISSKPELQV